MPNKPALPTRFSIACEGHEVPLPQGTLVMGRGSRCHIVVDDLLASREHARLTVTEDRVTVEDLGSTNGVYVNEQRIDSLTELAAGDRIVVGTQELELMEHLQDGGRAADLKDLAVVVPVVKRPSIDLDEPCVPSASGVDGQVSTEKADVVTTLGRLADRMLTMGRFDAAERVLEGQLNDVLVGARAGRPVRPDVFEAVVEYGLRLAEVTHKAKWVDYVIEIHMIDTRIMDGPAITRLASLLEVFGDRIDAEMFFFYKEALRGKRDDLPLADRVSCDRILKLETSA